MIEEISITRDGLFGINMALNNLPGTTQDPRKLKIKLRYAITKNRGFLENELKAISDTMKTNIAGFEEFEKSRTKKIQELQKKDSKTGLPIPGVNGRINIGPENVEEFKEFMEELSKKHKDDLEERDKEVAECTKFVLEKVSIKVWKIDCDLLPDDIPQSDFDKLFPIIIVKE